MYLEKLGKDYEFFNMGGKNRTEIYPNRDACALVYKFLKQNNGWKCSNEDLYFALRQAVTYGQLMFALAAFEEAGLINRDGGIKLNAAQGKVNLDETNILKSLKGRL